MSAEVTFHDKQINFELRKIDDTKYEIKLLPTRAGAYKVRLFLNGISVKGSPFVIKINAQNELESVNGKEKLVKPDVDKQLMRTELLENGDKSDLVVGKEFKLNGKAFIIVFFFN